MVTRLPHLRGLQVFDAVARHLSMSRAAAELAVGQPAVTQQIRRLEEYFGLALIERATGGVRLTREGELLARKLKPAMHDIRDAVAELLDDWRQTSSLRVVALGAFGYRWLIPRLPSFHREHPTIDVQLFTASTLDELARADVDVAIRCGAGSWSNHHSTPLMVNQMFPVISPRLCTRGEAPGIEELKSNVWIHVDAEPRSEEWKIWLSMTGQKSLRGSGELHVASSIHAIEAAIAGLGIAMSHTPFVWDALAAKNLLEIGPSVPAHEGNYHIVSPDAQSLNPNVSRFRDWLLTQT